MNMSQDRVLECSKQSTLKGAPAQTQSSSLSLEVSILTADVSTANEAGETPLDIAKRLRHTQCEELVRNCGRATLNRK